MQIINFYKKKKNRRASKYARTLKLVYITTFNVMDMIYSSTYFF